LEQALADRVRVGGLVPGPIAVALAAGQAPFGAAGLGRGSHRGMLAIAVGRTVATERAAHTGPTMTTRGETASCGSAAARPGDLMRRRPRSAAPALPASARPSRRGGRRRRAGTRPACRPA